jgi:hypothetical protein
MSTYISNFDQYIKFVFMFYKYLISILFPIFVFHN